MSLEWVRLWRSRSPANHSSQMSHWTILYDMLVSSGEVSDVRRTVPCLKASGSDDQACEQPCGHSGYARGP